MGELYNVRYVKRRFPDILFRQFVYVDDRTCLSEIALVELFKVHTFAVKTYKDPKMKYRLVVCKVFRWDMYKFLLSMSWLKDSMIICGRSDYEDFCKRILLFNK